MKEIDPATAIPLVRSSRRRRTRDDRGLSTLETLVAIGILALITGPLLQALAHTAGMRVVSSRSLQAAEHAISTVEQLRSGDIDIGEPGGGFDLEWSLHHDPDQGGLARFSVTVQWREGGGGNLTLEGLLWTPL